MYHIAISTKQVISHRTLHVYDMNVIGGGGIFSKVTSNFSCVCGDKKLIFLMKSCEMSDVLGVTKTGI